VTLPKPTVPVTSDGRTRLVCELYVASFYPGAIEIAGIDVLAGKITLATWRGAARSPPTVSLSACPEPAQLLQPWSVIR